MPKAFASAGWVIAVVLTGVLCLMRLVFLNLVLLKQTHMFVGVRLLIKYFCCYNHSFQLVSGGLMPV